MPVRLGQLFRMERKEQMNIPAAVVLLFSFFGSPAAFSQGSKNDDHRIPKSQIMYRVKDFRQTYDNITNKEHLAIKITPPAKMGPKEYVIAEIYNHTKTELNFMQFDLRLESKSYYELNASVTADTIPPGQSAVRQIIATGSGDFPAISNVVIENVVALNSEAKYIKPPVIVDLVRSASTKPRPPGRPPVKANNAPSQPASKVNNAPKK
ncbi:MAG: hypothetical protein AB7T49_18715 [Oligoflexales bacterium]